MSYSWGADPTREYRPATIQWADGYGVSATAWLASLAAPWRAAAVTDRIVRKLDLLERLIMATAEDLAARIDAATNDLAGDLQTIKAELAAALASDDAATQAAVHEALGKLDAPIARLESLGADNTNPVPDPEPTPEPEPADPTV